jgi:hypothetical protein
MAPSNTNARSGCAAFHLAISELHDGPTGDEIEIDISAGKQSRYPAAERHNISRSGQAYAYPLSRTGPEDCPLNGDFANLAPSIILSSIRGANCVNDRAFPNQDPSLSSLTKSGVFPDTSEGKSYVNFTSKLEKRLLK